MLNSAYSSAQFILELDGDKKVGFCRSVEGGGTKADILTYRQVQQGQWSFGRQLAAKPKFEDIKLQVGMSMSQLFYDWIEAFFRGGVGSDGQIMRKSGAIISGDFHMKERYRREFFDALVSEVAIPKCDAGDKNAASMGVTLVAEALVSKDGDGSDLDRQVGAPNQKLWTPNNFSFTWDGFDSSFVRATRVDGFSVKQQILEYHAGSGSPAANGALVHTGPGVIRVPGMIEFPNISVYIPEVDAKSLIDHFTKYGIQHREEQKRGTGALAFLGQDGDELCSISLEGMDIAGIAPDRADATSHDVKQVKVEFTCERMAFSYKANAQSTEPVG